MNEHERWLKYADEDLRMAEWAMKDNIFNQVCFHAQQCAEKSLKAILVHRGELPPKTHSLMNLIDLVGREGFSAFVEGLDFLDQIYLPTRYPDAHPGALPEGLPNQQQAAQALDTARRVFAVVKEKLSTSNG